MRDLVIVGSGGFGREVFDVVAAINSIRPVWSVRGFLDDDPSSRSLQLLEQRGATVLGPLPSACELATDVAYVHAISATDTRRALSVRAEFEHLEAAVLVHPSANVGANVSLGAGTVVCGHADVGCDVKVGKHVHLDRATQVGHDSTLGDYVTIHPAAVVSGSCSLEQGVRLGTNSTVIQGITVGAFSTVGAGACVVRDVLPRDTVAGVPARPL